MQPTGSIIEATSALFERTKTDKNEEFKWNPKRRAALEYLIQARGNVRVAAQLSKKGPVPISFSYLRDLKYSAKYRPFREEYRRRTGELLSALEVDTEFVLQGLLELTGPDIPPSTRRQALRDLGQYLDMWVRQRKEVGVQEAREERLAKAIKDEPDPAKKRELIEAAELISDAISRRRASESN